MPISEDKIVKKAYSPSTFTSKQIRELARCYGDPIYFMENFVYIQHPIKGRQLLKLYPFQREMIDAIHNNRFSILLTARQMGKTTVASAYLLWYAMFKDDATILIVANNNSQALEIMQRIRFAYEEIPALI